MNESKYLKLLTKIKELESLDSVKNDPKASELLTAINSDLNLSAETVRISTYPIKSTLQQNHFPSNEVKPFIHSNEENIPQQSELITKILASIPVGIFCRKLTGEFILWNQHCALLFKKAAQEVLGKNPQEIFNPDVASRLSIMDHSVIEEKETVELSVSLQDGKNKKLLRVIKSPFIENNQVKMTINIVQDVTEKNQHEEQKITLIAKEQESKIRKELEYVILNSEFAIYNLNLEPVPSLSYVSPNILSISGYSIEHLKQKVTTLFHSSSSDCNATLNQIFLKNCPEKISIEYPFIKENGEVIWLRNEGHLKTKGDTRQLMGFIVDITEHRKLELEKNSAIDATKVKSEFIAYMSHEIRTPINSVIGLNSLLLKTDLNDEQQYYSKLIHKSASALLEIINDILDLSKIEAGKLILESHPFKLTHYLKENLEVLGIMAKQKNLEFKVNLGELPNVVLGDSKHLGQLIRNLVSNSLKFTSQGYIEVSAKEINRTDDIHTIEFSIADSGIGIPEDKLDSIFNSYSQASRSITREYGGTGLGLDICRKIVQMMKGEISVESKVGKGTTFTFTIQLEVHSSSKSNVRSVVPKTEITLLPTIEKPAILIVEDNEINQLVLSGLLKKMCNPEITWARNGAIGVEEFKKNSYDLVFMDCQMPVLDGFSAAKAIRAYEGNGKKTPIVAITANAMNSAKEECFEAGMNEYITKPIEDYKLREILYKFINVKKVNPTTTASLSENPSFELKCDLTNLKALEETELIEQVVEGYSSSILSEIEKLKKSLEDNDLDESCFILHSIQGLSGNVGAMGLFQEARQLSTLIKEKNCMIGLRKIDGFKSNAMRYNRYFEEFLAELKSN